MNSYINTISIQSALRSDKYRVDDLPYFHLSLCLHGFDSVLTSNGNFGTAADYKLLIIIISMMYGQLSLIDLITER